jgi:hypothetical protein
VLAAAALAAFGLIRRARPSTDEAVVEDEPALALAGV